MDGKLYANGACDSCHGYPPVASMTGVGSAGSFLNAKLQVAGGGGHHTTHLDPNIVATDSFTPCLPCHPSDSKGWHKQGGSTVITANVNVFYDSYSTYRFDSSRSMRYNRATKNCSNVMCHFQPTPAW